MPRLLAAGALGGAYLLLAGLAVGIAAMLHGLAVSEAFFEMAGRSGDGCASELRRTVLRGQVLPVAALLGASIPANWIARRSGRPAATIAMWAFAANVAALVGQTMGVVFALPVGLAECPSAFDTRGTPWSWLTLAALSGSAVLHLTAATLIFRRTDI